MVSSIEDALIEKFGEPVSNTGSEIKFKCPHCGFKSLVGSLDSGVFYCFVCFYGKGEKPVLGNKKNPNKIKVNQVLHQKVLNWLCDNLELSPLHNEYLKSRGIYRPKKYKISSVPFQVEAKLLQVFTSDELLKSGFFKPSLKSGITGWPALKPDRIFIPYWVEDRIIGCKTRVDPYDIFQEHKYAIPCGSRIAKDLWCPIPLYNDIIITEGEFKAAAACELGYIACSTNGINGASAAGIHIPKYVKKGKVKRVFIIYDTELDPLKSKLVTVQSNHLLEMIPNSVRVTLPVFKGYNKQDLDSFLLYEGEDALNFLLEKAWKTR